MASILAGMAPVGLARAETAVRVTPDSRQQIQLSFAPLVKWAGPAVVNVYGARIERQASNPLFEDPLFRRFFGEPEERPERMAQSVGSGVIVDPSGIVVTNHHVIEGMTELKIALADRREFEADIILRDQRTDLAILRIKNGKDFPSVEMGDSDALEVGDITLAIGNPFGVGQTVTQGIVSALARTQVGISDYQFFIQTDAAINPGNSGGALISTAGKLIGINTAIFSKSGGSHGIGFAIPSNMVRVVVDQARSGGQIVRRPWVGVKLQRVTPEISQSLGLSRPYGALVVAVVDNGPAQKAGLKSGDLIVAIDGLEVDDPEGFGFRLGTKPVGGATSLTVLRAGKEMKLSVPLHVAPETQPRDVIVLKQRSPFSGATIANLSPAVAEELSLETTETGVVILSIQAESPAEMVGFQRGDVVVAINGEGVKNTRELQSLVQTRVPAWRVTINRGGRVFTTVLRG